MKLSEVPREKRLYKARVVYVIAAVAIPVLLCGSAAQYVLSPQAGQPAPGQHSKLLGWKGALHRPLAVSKPVLYVVGGLLTPLLVALLRAVTGAGRPAYEEGSRGPVSDEAFQRWLTRRSLFCGLAVIPGSAALTVVLAFGAMPLLWIVTGETCLMLLFYMPRARDLDPEAL